MHDKRNGFGWFTIAGLVGMIANLLRGGSIERWLKKPDWLGWKTVNLVICFSFFSIALGPIYGIAITIGQAIGQAFGWGPELRHIVGMDSLYDDRRKHTWGNVTLFIYNHTGLTITQACWASMVLRGLFWGGMIALTSMTIWPFLVGVTFPVWYWLAFKLKAPRAWNVAEAVFGFFLWGTVFA